MSSEFDFLEEWISAENIKVDVSPLNQNDENPSFEPCKESWLKPEQVDFWKSESERLRKEYDLVIKENETFRKDIIKLRSRDKWRCKVLDEQRVRLTQLLTEKLANKEEQRKIADYEKKLEEATLCVQATEQLNKQLQELSKSHEIDRNEWNEKLVGVEGKLRELKKINSEYKREIEIAKKKRKKLLVVILELWEIVQESGSCPKKYKRYIGICKTELGKNGDISDDDELVCKEKKEDIAKKSPSCGKEAQVIGTHRLKKKGSKLSNIGISPEFISESDSSEEEELPVPSGHPSSAVILPNSSPKSTVRFTVSSNHSTFSSEEVICEDKNTQRNFFDDGRNAGIVLSPRLSRNGKREEPIIPVARELSLSSLEDGHCSSKNNQRIGFSDKEDKSNAISSPSSTSSSRERSVENVLLEHSISSLETSSKEDVSKEDVLCSSKNNQRIGLSGNENKIDVISSTPSTSRGKRRSVKNGLPKYSISSLEDGLCTKKNNRKIGFGDKEKKSDAMSSPPSTGSSKGRSVDSVLPKHTTSSLEDPLCTKKNNRRIGFSDKESKIDVISSPPSMSSSRERSIDSVLPKHIISYLEDPLCTNKNNRKIGFSDKEKKHNSISSPPSISRSREGSVEFVLPKHTTSSLEDGLCTKKNNGRIGFGDKEKKRDAISSPPPTRSCRERTIESVLPKHTTYSLEDGLCTNKNDQRIVFDKEENSGDCLSSILSMCSDREESTKTVLHKHTHSSSEDEDCTNNNHVIAFGDEEDSDDDLSSRLSTCSDKKEPIISVPSKNSILSLKNGLCTDKNSQMTNFGDEEESNEVTPCSNQDELIILDKKNGSEVCENVPISALASLGTLSNDSGVGKDELANEEDSMSLDVIDNDGVLSWMVGEEFSMDSLVSADCEMKKCEIDNVFVDKGKTEESSRGSLVSADCEMKKCEVENVFLDTWKTVVCSKGSLVSADCLVSAEMKKCEVEKVLVDTGKTVESSKGSLLSVDCEMKKCEVDKVLVDTGKTLESSKGSLMSTEMKMCEIEKVFVDKGKTVESSKGSLVSAECSVSAEMKKCKVDKVFVDTGKTVESSKGSLLSVDCEMKKCEVDKVLVDTGKTLESSKGSLMSTEMKMCEIEKVFVDKGKTVESSKGSLVSAECSVSAEMKKCKVDKVFVDTKKTVESSKGSLVSADCEMKKCKADKVFVDTRKTCERREFCEMDGSDLDVDAILDKMCFLPSILQPFSDVEPPAIEKDDDSVDLQSQNNTLVECEVLSGKCKKTKVVRNGNNRVEKSFDTIASDNSSFISQKIFEECTLIIQAFDQVYIIVPESEALDLKSNGNAQSPINVKPWRFSGVLMEDEFGYTEEFLTLGTNTYLNKTLDANKTNLCKETEVTINCQNNNAEEEESSELFSEETFLNYSDIHNAESKCKMLPSSCESLPDTASNDPIPLTCNTENIQSPNEIYSKSNESEITSDSSNLNDTKFSSKVNQNLEVPKDLKCGSSREFAANSPDPCKGTVEFEEDEVHDSERHESQNKAEINVKGIEVFQKECHISDDSHVLNQRSDALKNIQIESETEVNKLTIGEELNKLTKVPEVNELESDLCEGDVSSEEGEYFNTDESQDASEIVEENDGSALDSYNYRINSVESSLQDCAEGLGILSSESDNCSDISNSSVFERVSRDSKDSVSFSSHDDDSSESNHNKNGNSVCGIEDDMAEIFIQGCKSRDESSSEIDFGTVSSLKESPFRHIQPMQSIRKEEKKVTFPKSFQSFNKGISTMFNKLENTEQDKCRVKGDTVFGFMSSSQPSFNSLSDLSSTPNSKCIRSPSNYFQSFTSGWSSSKIFLEKSENLDVSSTEKRCNSMSIEESNKSLFGMPSGLNKDFGVTASPLLMKSLTDKIPINGESKEQMLITSPFKTCAEESNAHNQLSLSEKHMSLLRVTSSTSFNHVIEKEKISPRSSIIVRHNYKSPNKSNSSETSINSITLTENIQSTITNSLTLQDDDKSKFCRNLFNEKCSEKLNKIKDGERSKVLSPSSVVACEEKENPSLTESSKILASDRPKAGFFGVKFLTGAQIRKNNSDAKEKNLDSNENTDRSNFPRRSMIPFFFGAFKPSHFFKVKFRILGHFASEFFIDPYASQKCSIINFGKGDLKDILFSGKAVDESSLTPKFSGVIFYKLGVFAPNAFTEQYLIPQRPVLNTFYPKYKMISSSNADCALFSPIASEGETIGRASVASESKASAVIRYGNSMNHKTYYCPVKVPDRQIGLPQLYQRVKKKKPIFHALPDSPIDIVTHSDTGYVDKEAGANGLNLLHSTVFSQESLVDSTTSRPNNSKEIGNISTKRKISDLIECSEKRKALEVSKTMCRTPIKKMHNSEIMKPTYGKTGEIDNVSIHLSHSNEVTHPDFRTNLVSSKKRKELSLGKDHELQGIDATKLYSKESFNFTHSSSSEHSHSGKKSLPASKDNDVSLSDFEKDNPQVDHLYANSTEAISDSCKLSPKKCTNISNCSLTEEDKNDMGNSQEFFDSEEESNFVIDTSAASDDDDELKCFRNKNGVKIKESLLKDVVDKCERMDGDSKTTLPEKRDASDIVQKAKKPVKEDMNSKMNSLEEEIFGSGISFDDSDSNKHNQLFVSDSNVSDQKNLYYKFNATEGPLECHSLINADPILSPGPPKRNFSKRKNSRMWTNSSNSEEEPVKKKRLTKKKVKVMKKLPTGSTVGYNSLIEKKSISKELPEQCPGSYPVKSPKKYSGKAFNYMVKKFVNEKHNELFADAENDDKSTKKDCEEERDPLIRLNTTSVENVSDATKFQQDKHNDHGHEKILDCLDSSDNISLDITSNSKRCSNELRSSFDAHGYQSSHKNRRKQSLRQYRFVEGIDQGLIEGGKSEDVLEALTTDENQINEVTKSVSKPSENKASVVDDAARGKLPDCSVDENYVIPPKKRRIAHTPRDVSIVKEIETSPQEENLYPSKKPTTCKPKLKKQSSSNSSKIDVNRVLKSKCTKLQKFRNKMAKAKGMISSSNSGSEHIRQSPRKHFIFSNIGSSRTKDKGSTSMQKISAPEKDIGKLGSNTNRNEEGTSSEELKSEVEINVQDKKDTSTSVSDSKAHSKSDRKPRILRSTRKKDSKENNGSKDSSLDISRTREKKCSDKELESLSAGQMSSKSAKKKKEGLLQTPDKNSSTEESNVLSNLNSEKNIAYEVITQVSSKPDDPLSSPCIKKEESPLSTDCRDVHKVLDLEESLENMEVPPPSPLSADELVDSFILYSNPNDENWTPMAPVKKCNASDITSCKDSILLTNNSIAKITPTNVVILDNSVSERRHNNKTIAIMHDAESKNGMELIKDCEKVIASANGMEGAKTPDAVEVVTDLISSDGNSLGLVNCDNDAKVKGSIKVDSGSEKTVPPSLQPKHISSAEEESSQGVQKDEELKDFFYKLMCSHKGESKRKVKEKVIDGAEMMTIYKKEMLKKELGMLQKKFFSTKDLDYLVTYLSNDVNAYEIKSVAKYLVRMLSKEDEDDIESGYDFHAPRLSTLQLRIISLILALERRCPKFEGLVNIIRHGISYMLFRLGRAPHVDIIMTLARVYTVLCKIQNNIQLARIFCFDALFSLGLKAYDLIFVVLSVWPEVLRKQNNDRDAGYIETSILYALSCQRTYNNESVSKKRAVQNLIKTFYKCELHKVAPNDVLNKFITALNDGTNLHGIEAAFILLGKRQGWEWTHGNLLCGKLMDVMQDWKNGMPAQSSAVVAINLIGLLSRSCAMETAGPIKPIIQVLSEALLEQNSYDALIQEALATSIVRLSRYYQSLAIRTLDLWVPKSLPPKSLVNMIISLIRRTPYGFWSQSFREWHRKLKKPKHINVCRGAGTYSTPGNLEDAFAGRIANKYGENSYIDSEDDKGCEEGKRVWRGRGKGPANSRWIAKLSESDWLKKEEETWKNIAWVNNNKQSRSVSLGCPR